MKTIISVIISREDGDKRQSKIEFHRECSTDQEVVAAIAELTKKADAARKASE